MELIPWRIVLTIAIFQTMAGASDSDYPPPCDSQIFCHGKLLHQIQMARLFKDSKTFVDMKLKYGPSQVLKNFDLFMDKHQQAPTKADLVSFVDSNFDKEGSEFEPWDPSDWHENPQFLKNISDADMKTWATKLHSFWKELGRKIKDDVKQRPELYSMIYTTHPVIVPGGRFREFFYWDSYWIMKGLLLSEMPTTVKGMLSNFLEMVHQLGYVPNGGRIYFRRSQPPFLIPMFKLYTDATNDTEFLASSIETLDREFQFWIRNRTVNIDLNGKQYEVVRYNVELDGPRPESYREDFELAENLKTEEEKRELYFNLKAGAESGWDYSSRWYYPPGGNIAEGSLIHTKTRHIIPVELNALIYLNAKIMADYYQELGKQDKVTYYQNVANKYKATIEEVFWDEEEGFWFDYNLINKSLHKKFYSSNIAPLWVGADLSSTTGSRVVNYLKNSGALKEPSGVPTSLIHSGEQWDYPNGWAPLQHLMVDALDKSDNAEAKELAFNLANKWIWTNFKAYKQTQHMFEKYDVTVIGHPGGGGEYDVVVGFGWTNGVVLDFLNRFGDRIKAPLAAINKASTSYPSIAPATIAIGGVTLVVASLFGITHVCRAVQTQSKPKSIESNKVLAYQSGGSGSDNEETVALMQKVPISLDLKPEKLVENDFDQRNSLDHIRSSNLSNGSCNNHTDESIIIS